MSLSLNLSNPVLGLELGSTRIKAVLAGPDGTVLASGAHDWQNRFEGGYWTYHLDEVWTGVQHAFRDLARNYEAAFGEPLRTVGALGVSAMMHGYLPFDRQGRPLTAFRTWRNTTTRAAAEALTERFRFNIPQRWTVAHFYQAILNGEDHVRQVDFLTTLAGYLHWQLTGQKVLGIGDASGVFPIDSRTCDYDAGMLASFDELLAGAGLHCHLRDLLPRVLCAGQDAGTLTEAGARLLDPTGTLGAGIPLCPPEGDAGTGMAATDSVAVRTGNVSAGTSVFAMVVLEKPLYHYTAARRGSLSNRYHPERLEDNFYLSDAVWDTVAAWGLQDSPMHRAKASYCTIRDLMMGIKNLGCSPLSLSEQTAWLRSTLQKPRVRTAVRSTPLHAMQSRNDQVKLLLLKLRLCRAVLLLSGANQRKNT